MGGSTPNASAVRNITFLGCPPTPGITALEMKSTGYAARVFSVIVSRSSNGARVVGSITTFSNTVPKRFVVA